ncbi:MAG: hypothetical protein K6B52_09295 [Clostridiales bacterium]|nr:hypothetical protein [Clostridiales bacterium]
MKTLKKLMAILLCFALISGSAMVISDAGLTERIVSTSDSRKAFGNKINSVIQTIVKGVCRVYPKPASWKSLDKYTGENVYNEDDGRQDYQRQKTENAVWKAGYSSASIIPADFKIGKYYLGRQLNLFASGESAKAKGILDDQRVRVICLDDNSGAGAVVMAVIDGLGVTGTTIRKIRKALSSYIEDGRIAAVNISATHCHSALDTQGVSTSFSYVFTANILTNLLGLDKASTSNDPFIENLVNVTAEQIKKAYANMEEGEMYYSKADISSLCGDKRGYVEKQNMPKAGIVRFVPNNRQSKPTYLVNFTCHPTNVSASAGLVSADYVYYMDECFKQAGANFVMTQGAVGQISASSFEVENKENYTSISSSCKEKIGEKLYKKSGVEKADSLGEKAAEILLKASNENEEKIEPILNTKYKEIYFKAQNYIMNLACQTRLVDNEVYTTGKGIDDVVMPSEIGYVELGSRVAFGLFPCELYPEVFHGQEIITADKENYSWDGNQWEIPAAKDMVREGIDIYSVCFANDYIGYVVPDNFYSGWGHWSLRGSDRANYQYDTNASFFEYAFGGTADQILSAGKHCASQIMNTFKRITDITK